MDETSPAARALLALELIQNNPGISGERLGQRLGVSDRAARRYVGILRQAAVPVESTPGRYGGYRLGRGFRVPPLMFSTEEALGLVMAALEGRGSGADPEDPVGRALSKIIRVLPAGIAQPAASLRQVQTPRTEAPPTNPSPETTAALAQWSAAGRRVRLRYATSPTRVSTMDVDPWAVSIWHGRWYLLCWSHSRDARRVLRVDRVLGVEVLPDAFDPPAGLDPVREIEDQMAQGWRYDVEVIIDAPASKVSWWIPRHLGRLEEIDAGHTRLTGSTDEPDWYCQRLAGIQAPFRIVRPRELAEQAQLVGRNLVRAGAAPEGGS